MSFYLFDILFFFFFKQKTAYEMRISDWSSDVCSSDLMQRADAVDQRLIQRELTPDVRMSATIQRRLVADQRARAEPSPCQHAGHGQHAEHHKVDLPAEPRRKQRQQADEDRKSTRLNSSH